MKSPGIEAVDWNAWKPQQRATLLFVIRDGKILLIHKKRGLGAGKINAPGGRIDAGETPLEAAIREVREELRITPVGVRQRGELRFQFVDGLSLHGYVFMATDCEGEPQETEEAKPLWTSVDEIPYHRMWADDRLWLPLMLEGHYFEGRFLFDGDAMRAYEVDAKRLDPSPRDRVAGGADCRD
jgi:8-oxo-dGTP diphosphatase